MGVKIIIKDADFSADATSYIAPVPAGLQYLNFFGGNQKNLTRNLAPGKAAGVLVGAPGVAANSANFSYLERLIKTGVSQTNDVTLIAVATPPTEIANIWRHLISNFGRDNATGGVKFGISLAFKLDSPDVRGTLGLLPVTPPGTSTSSGNTAAITLGAPLCSVVRADAATRTVTVSNKTTGQTRAATYAATLKPELNGEFYIGSAVDLRSDSVGDFGISFAAIYNRALTDEEITKIYTSLKSFYASRGVAI